MMHRWLRIAMVAILLFGLTGCWDQRSISQRAVVVAVGVSAHNLWTFVFPNVTTTVSSLSSIKASDEFYDLSTKADSWSQARTRIQREANHQISLGDLQLLLVSANLTTAQVAQIVDAINMDGTIPASFWIAASKTSPKTLLLQPSPQSVVPTFYLADYFTCYGCHAASLGVRTWQWWDRSGTPGVSPYLPLVSPGRHGALVRQLLVYRSQGTPRLMPRKVTQGFEYIMGHVTNGAFPVTVDGKSYGVSRVRDRAHVNVMLTRQFVVAHIRITAAGVISSAPIDTMITRNIELLVGQATGREVLQRCLTTIQWANQTKTDPFGYAKQAAWLDNETAAEIPPPKLSTLPIHAFISVRGIIRGEGVAH
ncbi:MAG: spore gernimation protein [Sulfobacillus benefaciens]|uniref:Spore gernimation protein n=1 Tax=Sulfobacillus benefaciens TaxID=453960 RepID=A0A2T2X1J9_9FIRM|nr:MAG: spore gernimation protein [Sulfobacillus benefaciens]